ncbi:MAG: zf-HC2 domain-containing protein [candidate division Zixibacteria bacterium]
MRCEDYQKLISLKMDNQLTDGEKKRLDEHLETCRECSEFASSALQFDKAISQMPKASMPEELENRIHKSISERPAQNEDRVRSLLKGHFRIPRTFVWVTAVVFILLIHKAFFTSPPTDIEMRDSGTTSRTPKVHTIVLSQADIVHRQTISDQTTN